MLNYGENSEGFLVHLSYRGEYQISAILLRGSLPGGEENVERNDKVGHCDGEQIPPPPDHEASLHSQRFLENHS